MQPPKEASAFLAPGFSRGLPFCSITTRFTHQGQFAVATIAIGAARAARSFLCASSAPAGSSSEDPKRFPLQAKRLQHKRLQQRSPGLKPGARTACKSLLRRLLGLLASAGLLFI